VTGSVYVKTIHYTIEPPESFEQIQTLYESLGWNSLNLTVSELEQMCIQSWYTIYAFEGEQLVGMGRVLSDGVITGIICGLGVSPKYQSKGIGKEMLNRIIQHCECNRVIPQLMCVEQLESYYESFGFVKFTIGMTRKTNR
jgi:GNAT superfamily N-acetyltransferase